VILWRDPWRSFRVLALGLYLALFFYQIFVGSLLVHPATLMMGSAFLYLLYNAVQSMRLNAANDSGGAASTVETAEGTGGEKTQTQEKERELMVFFAVQSALVSLSSIAIPVIASAAALAHRGLSGRHLVGVEQ
jgi:hypothetical protein